MGRFSSSFHRLGYIALNTLREAVRQRILSLVVLVSLFIVVGAHSLRDFHFGSPELKFIADLGLGAIAGFGAVLAVVLTAQLFFQEIEHHTVEVLLAKPVHRAEFILGKLLAAGIILAVFCALVGTVLAGVLWLRELSLLREWTDHSPGGSLVDYRQLATACLLQWFELLVLATLTLLVSTYARTVVFAIMMGFVIFLICHLQHFAVSAGEHNGTSTAARLMACLARCFPDFQLFQLPESASEIGVGWWTLHGSIILYAGGYIWVTLVLAIFSFRHREL